MLLLAVPVNAKPTSRELFQHDENQGRACTNWKSNYLLALAPGPQNKYVGTRVVVNLRYPPKATIQHKPDCKLLQ